MSRQDADLPAWRKCLVCDADVFGVDVDEVELTAANWPCGHQGCYITPEGESVLAAGGLRLARDEGPEK